MIKLAILSCAHIHTKGYIEDIAKSGKAQLSAIWDDNADRGRRYAQTSQAEFVPDLDTLLARQDIDGFIICSENTRHLPLLRQAVPVGKPIFCEKPFTTNVAEAVEALKLVRQHKTILHMGYVQPFTATMDGIRQVLSAKGLGNITHARFRNAHHAVYARWFDNPDLAWFVDPALSGGGALMDMGTHAVHLLRTLLGPVKRVCATIRNLSGVYSRVDDLGIAHLEFASGVVGTVEANWLQTGGIGGLEIAGSAGTLYNDPPAGGYLLGAPGQEPSTVAPGQDHPRQVARLIAAIEGRLSAEELEQDLLCAADSVAIVQSCYASSASGLWTEVPKVG